MNHWKWNGGSRTSEGYLSVKAPNHLRADMWGYVRRSLLVAEETLGRSLRLDEIVHHINGDKKDDRPDNLAVMTQSEHATLHGRTRYGNGKIASFAKLTEDNVREIRACYSYETGQSLADKFGVTQAAISNIQHHRCWKHVSSEESA